MCTILIVLVELLLLSDCKNFGRICRALLITIIVSYPDGISHSFIASSFEPAVTLRSDGVEKSMFILTQISMS